MQSLVITTQPELDAFCASVSHAPHLAIDTEFIRERTYFPRLCLIQVAAPGELQAAIDPLAEGLDLSPFLALLADEKILKIFHAARQDLEIFYYLLGRVPSPLFDTQIAASFLGYGESISYDGLISSVVGVQLDKAHRFTDWAARPLSDAQITYAMGDVTHLLAAFKVLCERLEKNGRLGWVQEECRELLAESLYKSDPDTAWQRLKCGSFKPRQLAILRELAAWREREAVRLDVPRGRILKDDQMLELAQAIPQDTEQWGRLRGFERAPKPERLAALQGCISRALAMDSSEWPKSKYTRATEIPASVTSMLQLLLKVQSEAHDIAPAMIAAKDDLVELAEGLPEAHCRHGWRYELFGQAAERLLAGELSLRIEPKKKVIVFA